MSLRTRAPARSSTPRRAARLRQPRRHPSGRPRRGRPSPPNFRIRTWLGLAAAAALLISIPWLGSALIDGIEALFTLLGLGILLLAAALTADFWLALKRPLAFSRGFWRLAGGLHLLILASFGLLGLLKPGVTLGEIYFAQSSLGGEVGHALVSNPFGIISWLAATVGGLVLIWPRGARLTGVALLVSSHWGWETLRNFFTALVPRSEESAQAPDRPYVPTWDEEYSPVEVEALPAGEDTTTSDAGELVDLAFPSSNEPSSYQRALPMGRPTNHGWELPPLDLLADTSEEEVRQLDNEARAQLIVETLKSFGVEARVVSINQGPTVTQFGIEPGWEIKTRTAMERDAKGHPLYDKEGNPRYRVEIVSRTRVRVNQITSLANDLALALAAPTIRIEAPVPGRPVVGIEVPNSITSLVALRSAIESNAFQRMATRSKLTLALGKGVSGEPVAADLAKMPHLLIAGATGSGKSVCINSIIACLLMHNTPQDVRFILIDPKRVELANFATIPHLIFSRTVTDVDDVVGTLQAVIHEMDSRYRQFASLGVRNVEAYNRSPQISLKLPYWVVIIDELADLMMAAPYQVERQICRLAQLARATGIHLIIATQRPSVDVVTGLIKANFPTRIAFAVSSQVDSRTIIDSGGAEKLLGRGDMLFMPTDASKPKRLQGSYVSDQELERIVAWWSDGRFGHLRPDPMDHLLQEANRKEEEGDLADKDTLLDAAKELVKQHSRVSTSLLQRRLHIGYPRAARLIDLLEEEGLVGPPEDGQSRRVLLKEGDWDSSE